MTAEKRRQSLLKILLNHQATIDMANGHNHTSLFFAAVNEHEAAIRTFLENDSAVAHILTSAQRTALFVIRDLR